MKKAILFSLAVFFLINVGAVSSDLKDNYAPRETIVGEIYGGILAPIYKSQVSLVRDGHVDVGFEYDAGKIGNKYYVWLIAPQNGGDYTLRINDVIAIVDGYPQVVDYEKNFKVFGATVNYSVKPGFISSSENFKLTVTSYSGNVENIEIDFPTQKQVTIYPGTNYIDFNIQNIIGIQDKIIKVGRYNLPARIVGKEYLCGDGQLNSIEKCDGANLNGQSCSTIGGGFVSGNLACSTNCLSFNTENCNLPSEQCGSGNLELCVTQGTCIDAGGFWYDNLCNQNAQASCDANHKDLCGTQGTCSDANGFWYNNKCNEYEEGAVCDGAHLGLCKTQGTCLDANGYWYNNSCNKNPAPSCSEQNKDLCTTQGTCIDAKGFWYDGKCNANAELFCGDGIINGTEVCDCAADNICSFNELSMNSCGNLSQNYAGGNLSCANDCLSFNTSMCETEKLAVFRINPRAISDVFPISQGLPSYQFNIVNLGVNEINNLVFDYDKTKFAVYPENATIPANETAHFNVTFNSRFSNYARGVVVASSGEIVEYLIFDVNFTSGNESKTQYFKDRESESSYYCSELGGKFCGSEESCSSSEVSTLDGNCCVGQCASENSSGGRSWIGYLFAGIALLILIIIFVKYRKTKRGGNAFKERVSQAEKRLP